MTSRDDPIEILFVEDDRRDVRLVRESLARLSTDVRLIATPNGDDGLELLAERRDVDARTVPDLVLLDLGSPRADGFAFLEAIREDDALTRVPVLVLTDSAADEDVLESYDRAANASLPKPDDGDGFATMIEAVAEFWFGKVALPVVSS